MPPKRRKAHAAFAAQALPNDQRFPAKIGSEFRPHRPSKQELDAARDAFAPIKRQVLHLPLKGGRGNG